MYGQASTVTSKKMIRDISQRACHCLHFLITHLLHLRVIKYRLHWPWVLLNCLAAHLLGLEVIRNKIYCVWFPAHCSITHLLHLKMVKDILQLPWVFLNCFAAHLLGAKAIRGSFLLSALKAHTHPCLFILGTRESVKFYWQKKRLRGILLNHFGIHKSD